MSKNERKIEEDIKINRFKLEEECGQHTELYHYWAEQLPAARQARDEAKLKVKAIEGVVGLNYRTGKNVLPIDDVSGKAIKLTESTIISLVDNNGAITKARRDYIEKEARVNELLANEEAMQQRRTMLGHLKDLWVKQYYSEPGNRTSTDDGSDAARKKLNERKDT